MRFVARFLIVLMVSLMLPLQGVAGVVMPFCGSGGVAALTESDHSAPHAASHHEDSAMHDHGAEAGTSQPAADCDQCGLCHLACAGGLPVSAPDLADSLGSVLRPAPQSNVTHFLPDPFLRPPRRAAC